MMKTKKKRLMSACLLAALWLIPAHAQVWGGRFVARAGFSADLMKGDNAVGLEMLPGYNASIDFTKPFYKNFFWDTGLMFGSRGYDDADSDGSLRAHALSIPLAAGYKQHLTTNCAIEVRFGSFFSVDMGGKLKTAAGHTLHLHELDGYHRCDGGIILAFGVWYKQFNLDFMFKRGFAKLWDDGPDGAVNHLIRLGYAF